MEKGALQCGLFIGKDLSTALVACRQFGQLGF